MKGRDWTGKEKLGIDGKGKRCFQGEGKDCDGREGKEQEVMGRQEERR